MGRAPPAAVVGGEHRPPATTRTRSAGGAGRGSVYVPRPDQRLVRLRADASFPSTPTPATPWAPVMAIPTTATWIHDPDTADQGSRAPHRTDRRVAAGGYSTNNVQFRRSTHRPCSRCWPGGPGHDRLSPAVRRANGSRLQQSVAIALREGGPSLCLQHVRVRAWKLADFSSPHGGIQVARRPRATGPDTVIGSVRSGSVVVPRSPRVPRLRG